MVSLYYSPGYLVTTLALGLGAAINIQKGEYFGFWWSCWRGKNVAKHDNTHKYYHWKSSSCTEKLSNRLVQVQAKLSSDLYQHWIATFSGRRRLRKSISGNLINFIRSDRCFVKLFAQQSVGGDVGGGLTVCKTVRVWLYIRVECFITSQGDSNAVEASPGLVTLPLYHDLPARAKVAMNYRSWWWLI